MVIMEKTLSVDTDNRILAFQHFENGSWVLEAFHLKNGHKSLKNQPIAKEKYGVKL